MMDSILTSIKKMLGIAEEYDHFDADLIIHINSVLMILTQLGVGPDTGYSITNKYNTWNEFLPDGQRLECVKSYVYLKVKQLFDPPTSSAVAESNKRLCDELEWRISITTDPG